MISINFFDLPIGSQFLLAGDTSTKVPKPYVRIADCEFSRPNGKRRWIMFRPNPGEMPRLVTLLNPQPIAA